MVCPLLARELLGPSPTSGPLTHPPIELRGRLPPSRVLRGRAWLLDGARCLLVKWVQDPKNCLSGFNPERVPVDFSGFID